MWNDDSGEAVRYFVIVSGDEMLRNVSPKGPLSLAAALSRGMSSDVVLVPLRATPPPAEQSPAAYYAALCETRAIPYMAIDPGRVNDWEVVDLDGHQIVQLILHEGPAVLRDLVDNADAIDSWRLLHRPPPANGGSAAGAQPYAIGHARQWAAKQVDKPEPVLQSYSMIEDGSWLFRFLCGRVILLVGVEHTDQHGYTIGVVMRRVEPSFPAPG